MMYVCLELVLNFVETWGDQHYIGLTGIELLGKDGEVIDLDMSMVDAEPRDLHHLAGHQHDDRTLDKSACTCIVSCIHRHVLLFGANRYHSRHWLSG